MIFVNTSLEVALERNEKRSRSVPEYIVKKSWDTVQSNIGKYQRLFGMSNFIVIDNNRSEQELLTQTLNRANKVIGQYLRTPVKNYIGKNWISKELQARKRM
jgi:thymidylate kinase